MSAIEVQNLSYAYPPAPGEGRYQWVLRGLNFRLEAGEFVSLMGATGAGKTTLAYTLNGIVPQSTGGRIGGKVLVQGLDTRRTPVPELARHVGLVFQDPETQFIHMNVEAEIAFGLESLGLPASKIRERLEWALGKVGLEGYEKRSPHRLSGGEKQRVAIASVMAMAPSILVLDEPDSSLDPRGKRDLFNLLHALKQERDLSVLLITQDPERVLEFSDRLLVLDKGSVAMEGPPEQVFSEEERLRNMGLGIPQMVRLAECLNRSLQTDYRFHSVEQAAALLENSLESQEGHD